MAPNYSLYLVTDSTDAILKGRHLPTVVKNAIEGGVTIVQYRDKTSDTGDLIKTAKELHEITKAANVPLLINDRVDVALAIDAEGVHIGQDDMDLETARKILGDDKIIGVTASSLPEVIAAAKGGANYLGLGTVFATQTKENTKAVVGPAGIRDMLNTLYDHDKDHKIKTVCIGGINASNAQRVLFQSKNVHRQLDGIAVVSAIVGAENPASAAKELKLLVESQAPWTAHTPAFNRAPITKDTIRELVPIIVKSVPDTKPLCHNMTNLVVQNFAANVALCVGGSPIMSNNGAEAPALASNGGSLVINMGTVTGDMLKNYTQAVQAYNAVGGPVLLDPVGAGASQPRKDAAKLLMGSGYFDVMKGNYNEIAVLAGVSSGRQRGVDASASSSSMDEKAHIVRGLAERERNIVIMTGETDIVSDGARTLVIQNGHPYLGEITGSGCTLGTTIAAFVAVYKEDKMLAAIAGMLMYEIAAERAASRDEVRGPGTFIPAFLDELYAIRKMAGEDDTSWIEAAKVRHCEGTGSPKSIKSN